jgi:transcriptional regulator with PAS, ATPase and Fis domain
VTNAFAIRDIVAVSSQMAEVLDLARRAGTSDAKTLITGESGVGKEVIAREVHARSPRAARQFFAVNCAGLTETLLESELFGHVKGSFTGAYRDKPGKLQLADGATLFLDEVGEMSLRMQTLLLRFLESGEVQPVGDERTNARVDVRVIAATNRSLSERVAAGQFREDLLYRLRVIHIHIPPLRERSEDIKPLIDAMLRQASRPARLSSQALRVLMQHRWPGNVRELQNVIEQAIWLAEGPVIEVHNLPEFVRMPSEPVVQVDERRTQVADQLFEALVAGHYSFWDHVHPLFLNRDLTRHDIRELVKRGLATTRGNYRGLLKLFGLAPDDYHRFHNFLAAHDCKVDFRTFRGAPATDPPVSIPFRRVRGARRPLDTMPRSREAFDDEAVASR